MKQKKSLLALTLVFALVFTSFVGIGNAEAKNSKLQKDVKVTKPLKNKKIKNILPVKGNYTKSDFESSERINKLNLPKKPKYPYAKDNESYSQWIKRYKKYKRKLKMYYNLYQKTLSKPQKLRENKETGLREGNPSGSYAIKVTNERNKILRRQNSKIRKINKKRRRKAIKRWERKHHKKYTKGKLKYKRKKYKKYIDAHNIYKNRLPKSFHYEYLVDENNDCPINNSVQIKLTWESQEETVKYCITKCSFPYIKNGKKIIETFITDKPEFIDPIKYTDENLDEIPEYYYIHAYTKNGTDYNFWNIKHPNFSNNYTETVINKLFKIPIDNSNAKSEEDLKYYTGISEAHEYYYTKSLNKLRATKNNSYDNNHLPALEYSKEMNKYMHIRAEEISRKFEHERPDGSSCDTVFPKEKVSRIEFDKNKWDIRNEGISADLNGTGYSRFYVHDDIHNLWDSPLHQMNLRDSIATHVAIGAYFNNGASFVAVTPICTGEKGYERLKNVQKHQDETMDNFLRKCNLNPDNYRSKADKMCIVNKIGGPYWMDCWLSFNYTEEGAVKLCKPFWYDGMSLYKVVCEFCNRASEMHSKGKFNPGDDDNPSTQAIELMKEVVEKYK